MSKRPAPRAPALPELLRAADVARLFDVTPRTVYSWAENGTLPAVRIGGTLRFERAVIEAAASSGIGQGDDR